MHLTVLGWSGCPTTGTIDEWMTRVCLDAGVATPTFNIEYVETDDEAIARRFIGSPTFLVGGVDLFPEPDAPPSLTCRLYRKRDGRASPLPDPLDFVAALNQFVVESAAPKSAADDSQLERRRTNASVSLPSRSPWRHEGEVGKRPTWS